MRYAVTGATGFVGGRLVERLRGEGHQVVALVRSPDKAGHLRDLGVELVPGDVTDAASVRESLQGADGLFHVAGWYRVGARDSAPGWQVNVEGTRTVLEQMRVAGTARGVYTSTLAVNSDTRGQVVDESHVFNGRHLSVYDETKAAAHRIADEQARDGLPLVTVMPGLVYGPGDTSQTGAILRQLLAGKRPLVPAAGAVCWGHIDDIVDGHVRAMDEGKTGGSYMLAGPAHGLAEAMRLAARLAGVRGPLVLPAPVTTVSKQVMGLLERFLPVPEDFRSETLRAATATYLGTSAKAAHELGWSARPLREGLQQTIDAERARQP